MIFSLLLVMGLFLSSIQSSWFRSYAVQPLDVILDIKKFIKYPTRRPLNPMHMGDPIPKKHFDLDILHWLYLACETGELIKVDHFEELGPLIFEANTVYPFTPAEWAIHRRQNGVFRLFLEDTLVGKRLNPATVQEVGFSLTVMAIQYRNLRALKSLKEVLGFDFRGRGLLSLAIQHHVDVELLKYLLNDFKLIDEINRSPPPQTFLLHPLDASIKFNNALALDIILERAPSLKYAAVYSIMSLNRQRLLMRLLYNYKDLCYFTSVDRGTLFHAAVANCFDPNMIGLIAKHCPNLSINAVDKNNFSPLSLSASLLFEFPSAHRLPMIKALLSNGADLFNLNETIAPIEMVLDIGNIEVLTVIVDTCKANNDLMHRIVQLISVKGYWLLMDTFIEIFHRWIPLDWFQLNDLKVSALVAQDACLTFHYLLESGHTFKREEVLEALQLKASENFRNIATKFYEDDE